MSHWLDEFQRLPLETSPQRREVDIWSEGTRLSATLWTPGNMAKGERVPAILVILGWGGVRLHADTCIAPQFADQGFAALTFDFRGWGDSDSRLVCREKQPAPDKDGYVDVRAQSIRQSVDPFAMLADSQNALHWLMGEPMVDTNRIGLWGTSMGGGFALQLAARDRRIKACVSQVAWYGGGIDKQTTPEGIPMVDIGRQVATAIARGDLPPIPQPGDLPETPGLTGIPHLGKLFFNRPIDEAHSLTQPSLIISAENEELFASVDNADVVHAKLQDQGTATELIQIPGSHYDAYKRKDSYEQSMTAAIRWFDKYL